MKRPPKAHLTMERVFENWEHMGVPEKYRAGKEKIWETQQQRLDEFDEIIKELTLV